MSDAIEATAEFLTYHNSNGAMHLRTSRHLLFIEKGKDDMMELARSLQRGDTIKFKGEFAFSKTLSTQVLDIESLELA